MDLIENLIELGVTRVDFDMELERTIFEIKYLFEQKKVIYSFIDVEEWNSEKQEKNIIFEIDFF